MNVVRTRWFAVLFAALFLCALAGCGYSIHGRSRLPFDEVRIGRIENRTYEPKLQDRLQRALTEEFIKQGITTHSGAPRTLSCVIGNYAIAGISEKAGVISEYQVTIDADCTLTGAAGEKTETRHVRSPFIVSFSAQDDFGRLIADKESAAERAALDIAADIVAGFILK